MSFGGLVTSGPFRNSHASREERPAFRDLDQCSTNHYRVAFTQPGIRGRVPEARSGELAEGLALAQRHHQRGRLVASPTNHHHHPTAQLDPLADVTLNHLGFVSLAPGGR